MKIVLQLWSLLRQPHVSPFHGQRLSLHSHRLSALDLHGRNLMQTLVPKFLHQLAACRGVLDEDETFASGIEIALKIGRLEQPRHHRV